MKIRSTALTPELQKWSDIISERALSYGLDPFKIIFERLTYDALNEVAAFGGFPTRYPHWRFGMEYERLRKGYTYGLQKIYELVINNDPCYAYLLSSNGLMDQKLVMCHVQGHSDFFKNNFWFSKTNRKMMDEMANHGSRIREYIDRYGLETVEAFLDCALSLENLIDRHSPFIRRRSAKPRKPGDEPIERKPVSKLKAKSYMDRYINPPDFMQAQKDRLVEEFERQRNFPEEPERDVLLFLIEHAPKLERWQRDILTIVRDEAYYFAPQGMTKIMNEGWASYWHSFLMTREIMDDTEVVEYADHHSGTLGTRPGTLNPYKVGIELFRNIEERWNTGRFGGEYDACDDMKKKRTWDLQLGRGREKIFEVRKIFNDITFIDEFLTEEFCHEQKMFLYDYDNQTGQYVISDRDYKKVKDRLLQQLSNFGDPIIHVENANYLNRGELLLVHRHDGSDLKLDEAKDTLHNLFKVWARPTHIETRVEKKRKLLSYDGKRHTEKSI